MPLQPDSARAPGRATESGTARYRDRFASLAPGHFRQALGLYLSSIGLGTYLGEHDADTDNRYIQSVIQAARAGCNVIDTAINYRFQRSERAIGAALAELFAADVARDEILICTKGGYLAFDGAPPDNAREWIVRNLVRPGIVQWNDIVSFNVMQPAYLRHELEQSLANLRLDCIDVYYLHNPEAQLDQVDRPEFQRRMHACFEELERAVGDGQISVYGAATWNGLRIALGSDSYLSLEELVSTARSVAGDRHHFKAIQVPCNLAMPEAFTVANQAVANELKTLLAAASDFGIAVFGSASLFQARLTRLPGELAARFPGLRTDAQRALQFARSTPGITTALVGMSSAHHLQENLELATHEPLTQEEHRGVYR